MAAYVRLTSRSQAKFQNNEIESYCGLRAQPGSVSACRLLDSRRATSSQWGRRVGSGPLILRSIHEDTS